MDFFKMSGSGNDFILVDDRGRNLNHENLPDFIKQICQRKTSVGADGFIVIENSEIADIKWRFYNADGSKAQMCGNGARCAARFAVITGMTSEKLTLETDAGIVSCEVSTDRVKISLPDAEQIETDYTLKTDKGDLTVSSLKVGVPHVVIFGNDWDDKTVFGLGRQIRYHERYKPDGTNVNFTSVLGNNEIMNRTYERGVEDETLACGTGAVAVSLIGCLLRDMTSPVSVSTRGRDTLRVYFERYEDRFVNIYLEGEAKIIYNGKLWKDAWQGGK